MPLVIGASTVWLLCMNTTGGVFAAAILFAWLFPLIEARLRHQQLELTTDFRRFSGHEFELLVGELLRARGGT